LKKKKKRPKTQHVGCMTDLFIFRRLKINHVSHEFILEFGTVTNRRFSTIIIVITHLLIINVDKLITKLHNRQHRAQYCTIVNYCLSFADQRKQTSIFRFVCSKQTEVCLFRFPFTANKRKLPFSISSVFRLQNPRYMET
jgi:hypothetical protein